jgi:hypothetical protein
MDVLVSSDAKETIFIGRLTLTLRHSGRGLRHILAVLHPAKEVAEALSVMGTQRRRR